MSVNLQLFARMSARIDNTIVVAGSTERPINYTITGIKHERTVSIANAANAALFAADVSAFSLLWLESDYNTRVLLTDTNSNTFSIWLRGTGVSERYGVPFILANDNTASTFIVNSVQVFNTSGNTAKVHILIAN